MKMKPEKIKNEKDGDEAREYGDEAKNETS